MDTTSLSQFCADSAPQFLGLFDFSIAPPLLFYSYIPTALVALVFGIFFLRKERDPYLGKGVFFTLFFFVLWVLNIIIQWTGVPHSLILGGWEFTALFEIGIIASIIYSIAPLLKTTWLVKSSRYVFISLGLLFFGILATFSTINIQDYDFENCEGVIGPLWYFIYGLEIITLLFILGSTIKQWFQKTITPSVILTSTAFALFLGFFSISNIIGEITQTYEINLYGPIGLVLFIGFLLVNYIYFEANKNYTVVLQTLVYSAWFLIASLIFINDVDIIHIIIVITLFLSIALGVLLFKISYKEIEQKKKLEELTIKLKELDATKNEFLSFATHQLRSPLTSLKWGLNAVSDAVKNDANTTVVVSQLRETADNMISTVNDLLDISKIEQGGLVMTNEPIDLMEMVEHLAEEFRITAEKKGLSINFSTILATAPILGDKTKLRQVLVNIVDNAIKYTPSGSVAITLLENQNNQFVVSVTDTGAGISKEEAEKLFTKFARGAAGKTTKGGSGLGLYLAKKIMELHHGDISVSSPGMGQGSTFTVTLPKKIS